MKTAKKILVLLLTALLICTSALTATASVIPPVTETYAGETVSIDFSYDNIAGIFGNFTTSGDDIIESITIVPDSDFAGTQKNNTIAFYAAEATNFVCKIEIKVKDSAKKGDECKVTFKYETTEDGKMPTAPEYEYEEATIKIVLDYTELDKQIGIAQGLNEDLYTEGSWAAMKAAWDAAIKARSEATTQAEIDAAAKALADAIAALRFKDPVTPPVNELDYTELDRQIGIAQGLNEDLYTEGSWAVMKAAWDAAIKARAEATTQAEIDAAAKALADAIAALELKDPQDPTPDDPTPDEPTPDEPTPDEPTPDEPTPDEPEIEEPEEDKLAPDSPSTEGVLMVLPIILLVAALVVLFVYISKKKIKDL